VGSEFTDSLSDKCLAVVRVPPRQAKPRTEGLTIIADRGLGRHAQEDLLETCGPYIDVAKLAMGVSRLVPEAFLRAKIERYRAEGVPVFFAGEISELALIQGVSADYFREIKALGGWGVEVSNAQIALSLSQKVALIEAARREGLEVIAECGKKGGVSWTKDSKLIMADVSACLAAGAHKVLIQAEGLNEGTEHGDLGLIPALVGSFGLNSIIFQAKEQGLISWFLMNFGNRVNVDIDTDQVLDMESQRRGIRKRGVFGLMT
jgi:phosphosulfolactate synthase